MPFISKLSYPQKKISYQDNKNLISWQFNMPHRILYKMSEWRKSLLKWQKVEPTRLSSDRVLSSLCKFFIYIFIYFFFHFSYLKFFFSFSILIIENCFLVSKKKKFFFKLLLEIFLKNIVSWTIVAFVFVVYLKYKWMLQRLYSVKTCTPQYISHNGDSASR